MIAMGTVVLLGDRLHTTGAGIDDSPMKTYAALSFILSGAALLMALPYGAGRARVAGGIALATMAMTIGGTSLAKQIVFGNPAGGVVASLSAAPFTSIEFLLLGTALLLTYCATATPLRYGQLLAAVGFLTTLPPFVGFLYAVPVMDGEVVDRFAPTLPTALGLLVLASGILCIRPERGYMAALTGSAAGSILARRMLVAALIIPLILGWLRLQGERIGLYDAELGAVIIVVAIMAVIASLAWFNAVALNRAEARARLILDNALDAFIAIDEKGRVLEWNRQAELIFGWPLAEILGKPLADTIIPERYRQAHRQGLARFMASGEQRILNRLIEIEGQRRDGSEFPVELSIIAIEAGDKTIFSASLRDIGERKRVAAELQALNTELEQRVAQRTAQLHAANKELEGFSYSISHDLRVPLRAINGFSGILEEEYGPRLDDEARRLMQVIRDNCRKMSQLIDEVLAFSRLGRKPLDRAEIDMADIVREAIGELAAGGPVPPIDIGPLPIAYCDRLLMRQVWQNLLANAIKFSSTRTEPKILVRGNIIPTEQVYSVADNGVGFDMEYYDKLFGVFQRLHSAEEFPGTGVGLAIVQRIVLRHGGRVWAEGKIDRGATFYFTLPTGAALG